MVISDSIPSYISYIGRIPVISPVRSDVSGISMLGVEFCGVSPEAQPDANAAEVLLLTRKSQKKEDPGARKGRKVAKHDFSNDLWLQRGSKSRLAKAAGAEPAGQM